MQQRGSLYVIPAPTNTAKPPSKGRAGVAGIKKGVVAIYGKAFILTLCFLDRLKSGSFIIQSRSKATVDAHGMFYISLPLGAARIVSVRMRSAACPLALGFIYNASAWVSGVARS